MIESVIDCFVRLYSLKDKLARIINSLFSLGLKGNVGPGSLKGKLAGSDNRYLRAIGDIFDDMFPSCQSVDGGCCDPKHSMSRRVYRASFLRNNIMHGTFELVGNPEKASNEGVVASITTMDLETCTSSLMYDVREIILTMKLADSLEKQSRMVNTERSNNNLSVCKNN